jgi:transcriptional regulator with XRE-family HTH domain
MFRSSRSVACHYAQFHIHCNRNDLAIHRKGPKIRTLKPSEIVAQNIREVRAMRGFSAAALARRVGFPKSKMTRLEGGSQSVTLDELFAIAMALSVAPAVLLTPWGEDGEALSIAINPHEQVIFDGPDVTNEVFDFIIGRLNPGFALFLNAREFANTGPKAVRENARNAQVFASLEELGWEFRQSSTTSPGGITRSEGGDA